MFGALNTRVVRLPATHEIFSDAETRGANLPRAGFDLHNLLFPALAAALFLTNRWFSILDDEANFIVYSTEPVRHTLELYRAGMYHHAHPPLPDIILHFWLALTASRLWLLRVPAIGFYVTGLWLLARAAERLAGREARLILIWMAVLWPFGFHFGRLAGWYEVTFFAVCLITYAYAICLEDHRPRSWLMLSLSALFGVYCNTYVWAMLGLLLLDLLLRRDPHWKRYLWVLLAVGAAYVPGFLLAAKPNRPFPGVMHVLAMSGYTIYCTLVSESVAPWVWWLGVPAAGASCVACGLVLIKGDKFSRCFLLYFALLVGVLAALDFVSTKRAVMLTPWLLLTLAVAVTHASTNLRRALIATLAMIAVIGWFGTFARRYYAAPHFVEPWQSLSAQVASDWRAGAIVISNNGPFLFYMGYATGRPWTTGNWSPETTLYRPTAPRVYHPQFWPGGSPLTTKVVLVRGVSDEFSLEPTARAQAQLEGRCALLSDEKLVPDPGYHWKRRVFPGAGQLPWRLQVRTYKCVESR